jgi:hypothetical protein
MKIERIPGSGWLALLGGGEFSFGETLAADRAWIELTPPGPIGFIPAASDSADYGKHFSTYMEDAFQREVEIIPIYRSRDARRGKNSERIAAVSAVYLGGGVGDHLLEALAQSPAAEALAEKVRSGGVVVGIAAAAQAAGCVIRSIFGGKPLAGLGLLPHARSSRTSTPATTGGCVSSCASPASRSPSASRLRAPCCSARTARGARSAPSLRSRKRMLTSPSSTARLDRRHHAPRALRIAHLRRCADAGSRGPGRRDRSWRRPSRRSRCRPGQQAGRSGGGRQQGLHPGLLLPKADTSGCTKQACSLRDAYAKLQEKGVRIYGVSGDDVAAQKAFEVKYHLPFRLIADHDQKAMDAFGVPHNGSFATRQAFCSRTASWCGATCTRRRRSRPRTCWRRSTAPASKLVQGSSIPVVLPSGAPTRRHRPGERLLASLRALT